MKLQKKVNAKGSGAAMGMQENKMGVMPVNRLLVTMSLPIMVSMLVQALYNVVDSIYVSYVSENALTAVSLAFPIQNLMIAVAVGTGVGVNALLSKSLGEKNFDKVNRVAENGVFLAFLSYIAFLLIGLFAIKPFFYAQTDIPEIVNGGISYLRIVCCVSFGAFGQIMFERLMQSTGKTLYTMFTQGFGAIINIILDPLMIFEDIRIFGVRIPGMGMGVAGAAVATVIGQICACIFSIILNQKRNHEVRLNFRGFKPNGPCIREIYMIAFPSIIMQSIGSVMTFCFNKILIAFTETAVAVFGVYFKLQSFIFMPVFGLNNGLVPIVSYNFGAGKRTRLVKAIKLGVLYAMVLMIVGAALMILIPETLLSFFNATPVMVSIGVPALRTIALSFVFAGFCIAVGSVFQSVGKSFYSLFVSLARQLCVLIPCAYILKAAAFRAYEAQKTLPGAKPLNDFVSYVWWAFPIAEIASLTVTVICFLHVYKTIIAKMPKD